MPTKKVTETQVTARVPHGLRKQMRYGMLYRGTDFTKWLNVEMQRYVDETQAIMERDGTATFSAIKNSL